MSLNCLYNLITLKGGNHMSDFDREKLIELENEFYEKFSEELDYQDEILRFYAM